MPSDRDPNHLFPAFWEAYSKVLVDLQAFLDSHYPGYTCKLVEGFRPASYQAELYAKGRTAPGPIVTYKDGKNQKSNHQSGLAADIGIFHNGAYLDDAPSPIDDYYGHCVRAHGLSWGGDWNSFKDLPHAEWPTSDRATYAAAQSWLKIKNLIQP